MPRLVRMVVAVLLLAVIGFCVFGFLATFEPLDARTQLSWRIIYGTAGGVAATAIIWLLLAGRKHS